MLFLSIQVYSRLNQVGLCVSYPATLVLLDEIAKLHTAPLSRWLATSTPFMFWGDNVDKHRSVRDMRSDHRGSLLHMYSILAGSSRTTDPTLSQHGRIASISSVASISLLPKSTDISSMRSNLIVIVARFLTQHFKDLKPLSTAVASHIQHEYSREMSTKSDVVVVDILYKNEASRTDMIDIMIKMQEYLGSDYPNDHRLLSAGDQLTCERQVGAQMHRKDGDSVCERLNIFEPVTSDWHCMVCLLSVSTK